MTQRDACPPVVQTRDAGAKASREAVPRGHRCPYHRRRSGSSFASPGSCTNARTSALCRPNSLSRRRWYEKTGFDWNEVNILMTIGSLFLAVQGASSPRIGPTESRPRHGKGILKRVRRRNILTASCISQHYIWVRSRSNPAAALAYSDGDHM